MLIYKSIENGWDKKVKVLGLTIYRRCLIDVDSKPYCEHKYLKGLFKVAENKSEKRVYICGIRFAKYNKPITYEMINEIIKKTENNVLKDVHDVYWDMHVLNQVSILHKAFLPYKRCNEGKEVVLVATGPSASFYKDLIPNAIHIGINAAIHFDWIKFDYIFANDGFLNNPELNFEIDNYRKGKCKKFYGIHSPRRLAINRENGMPIDRISQFHFYNANAMHYVLEDSAYRKWAVNLECEPFGDIGGTSFSALQFICYTHPKKIFLVGCDCGQSYSKSANLSINYNNQIRLWKMFNEFISSVYPDIEIISINPVGLKGLFKDVYTNDYINDYFAKQSEEVAL